MKAKATDRLKTPEEIAKEEKERLERLEVHTHTHMNVNFNLINIIIVEGALEAHGRHW